MNLNENSNYQFLKKKILNILTDKASNEATYSISLLNLIKSHPTYNIKYKLFFDKKHHLIKIYFNELIYFFKFFNFFFERQIKLKKRNYKNIFVSHYMNTKQNLKKDINFKRIKNSLFLYLNHTYKKNLNYKISKHDTLVLPRRLSLTEEIKLFVDQLNERKRLIKIYSKKKDLFYRFIAADSISPSTISNIRISKQIIKIIKFYKPQKYISTFEGYSWEKTPFKFIKKNIKNCKSYGYIPGLLLKDFGSNAIIYKKEYFPDYLLASGENTIKKIQKILKNFNNIYLLGSIKNLPKKISSTKKNNKTILLIPEGINSELKIFKLFLNKILKKTQNHNFILRLHPVSKNSSIFNDLIEAYKNLKLSDGNLKDDISKSTFVIYRGSSLIVNCVYNGLYPIYLKSSNQEVVIDPIYDYKNKLILYNPKDILKIKKKSIFKLKIEKYFSKYNSNILN